MLPIYYSSIVASELAESSAMSSASGCIPWKSCLELAAEVLKLKERVHNLKKQETKIGRDLKKSTKRSR
ncbi:hypothetical protein KQX54_000781 [Cotesia glomerata]|uniref:Uncharacterized protein n=1 Tax=Cotesia glomerata TaxID=32391 RepID=A0AAV7IIG4_COTGL|nr:hypothetical protein KQX54_000781 [Cotesia glomerata]